MITAGIMMFGMCDRGIAYAADEIGKTINPTRDIVLNVPEKYQDGGNWFFIAQPDWSASEKSNETMYIPIQRTGDLGSEADITLKVIDLSAKHDVNYTAELYKDSTEAEIAYADMSVKELVLSDDVTTEEFEPTDENGMGQMINEMGGADITDSRGNVIGTVKATPLDENGNPVIEEENAAETEEAPAENAAPSAEEETPAEADKTPDNTDETAAPDKSAWSENLLYNTPPWTMEASAKDAAASSDEEGNTVSHTQSLREARNAFTGTVSDRQELKGGDISDLAKMAGGNTMSEDEFDKEMADATQDGYPGARM